MTDDKVKELAREAGFNVGTIKLNFNLKQQFVSPQSDNCLVEVKNLIEIAREEPCHALQQIASYIGVGGYNMDDPLDIEKIKYRIMNEFDRISNVE